MLDPDLLNRHKASAADLLTEPGCYTNWLGLRTDASLFGVADAIRGRIFPDPPTHDDGVYGGYVEYASLLTAVEAAPSRARFTAVELGAGWGPWISAAGVICRRLDFGAIALRGVEADAGRCELLRAHLARNGLIGQPAVDARAIHAAAWREDGLIHFPVITPNDHGAAASVEASERDYRGHRPGYIDVPAMSLPTICAGLDVVDYMHWDIQGAELTVARSSAEFLNARVRFVFIGTHSRPIEGGLIAFFYDHGWDVLEQTPCQFTYDRAMPSLEGMTTTDGEIFARNPRL